MPKKRLCAPPSDWKGPSELYSELSGYPFQRKIEAAGRPYQELMILLSGGAVSNNTETKEDLEDDEVSTSEQRANYEAKRHKRLESGQTQDLYEILGIEHLGWKATEDDIKQAYKKMVLKYHPDKNPEVNDEVFKKIQNAYDLLLDPRRRRAYDSEDDGFNYKVPNFNETMDFFSTFAPVFAKISKWSADPNVPSIGDPDTPYAEVNKFYDFWFTFKSWRDFSFLDEFDVNEAETREEKRWMERQNEKGRRKQKQEEASKIRKIVEAAEKNDPRIKKHKEEQRQKKLLIQQQKEEEARKKREEAERIAALEREKKELEEKKKQEELERKKKEKQQQKDMLKKARSRLRKLCAGNFEPNLELVEMLCANLSMEDLTTLGNALEQNQNDKTKSQELFDERVNQIRRREQEAKEKEERERKEKMLREQAANKTKPWTEDEIALLAKGIAKYPPGVQERWQLIANFVGTRSMKEVMDQSKLAKSAVRPGATTYLKEDAYERFNKNTKKTEVASELSVRDEAYFEVEATKATNNNSSRVPQQEQPKKSEKPATTQTSTPPTSAPSIPKEVEWSGEDQKALEKALSKFPASETERWDKIAAAVPGKTKKDCIARYKYLVEQLKQAKAQKPVQKQ